MESISIFFLNRTGKREKGEKGEGVLDRTQLHPTIWTKRRHLGCI